jgi:hypothetical protein
MRTHQYRIIVFGALGDAGREAFRDFRIEPDGARTALVGDLDQAALHGAINRILAFGLELIGLSRLAAATS